MRRPRRRDEMNRIQVESFLSRLGHRHVTRVDRIKCAAEKRNGSPVPVPVSVGFRRMRTQTLSPGGPLSRSAAT